MKTIMAERNIRRAGERGHSTHGWLDSLSLTATRPTEALVFDLN